MTTSQLFGSSAPRNTFNAFAKWKIAAAPWAVRAWLTALLALFPLVGVSSLRAQTLDQLAEQIRASGYVSDFAGVLSQAAKDQLTGLCTEVDQKVQAQVAVVTVKSLNGDSIDQLAPDLFARVGVGDKATNRGVLILFAIDDHQYRTEVGYGLEPILPDGKVGGFGREAVPYLRQGNYDAATELMTRRVADVIAADRGVTLTGAVPLAPASEGNGGRLTVNEIILIVFFGWFIFSMIRAITRRGPPGNRINRGGGWWVGPVGGGWGGGGWSGGSFGGGGGGGFGGFGGGMSGGGGASGSW
jgi:uncharacterized protein